MQPDGCWVLASDLGQTWAKVGGLYSTIQPVTKKLSWSEGSTTGTSILLSTNGGDYKPSGNTGSNSVSNETGTQGFPNSTGNVSYYGQTEFEVGVFNTCQVSADVSAFPYAVNGGAKEIKVTPPSATWCDYQQGGPNDKVIIKTTQAITYAEGVGLTALGFGFNLSSSTGYTTSTQSEADYAEQGYSCGVTNYPLRTGPGPSAQVADEHATGN
jgi:hypothetical protein